MSIVMLAVGQMCPHRLVVQRHISFQGGQAGFDFPWGRVLRKEVINGLLISLELILLVDGPSG
ncbi:LOW QUALITY PROTEIN: uncharacterized protein LOC119369444 [Jatropha curcas]|uniref:LOW QUALITY PROTEIN: uncharacterized protein LOC119369444 n=1 Tax=Jatropha curcas TaxID=180498 RepID=UPI0018941718|nr:LOW QUALITY PROTEIN: uncharacterized protein LOC119369444 [Jatropha curcas]